MKLDNPTEILIVEAKQFKQGKILDEFDGVKHLKGYHEPSGLTLNSENKITLLPIQMSRKWIDHVRRKLLDKGGRTEELSVTLENKGIVQRYVFAIDKGDGSGYSHGQTIAKQKEGNVALTYKPTDPKVTDINNNRLHHIINQGDMVTLKKFYKIYGDGEGKFIGIK